MAQPPLQTHTSLNISNYSIAAARRIIVWYAAFSGLWILVSDNLVLWLFSDPLVISRVSIAKGWFFVAVTSLLLFGLIRRMQIRAEDDLARDMAVRLQAEQQRATSELRMRALIQAIPDLVWLKDPNGIYLNCNVRFEQFFGAPEHAIVGKTDYDFVSKELADFFRKNDQIAMDQAAPSTNEEWVTFATDGHRELLETTKTPVLDAEGRVIGVLGISHNVTERRRLHDSLLAAQQSLSQLNLQLESEVATRSQEVLDLYDQAPCGYHTLSPEGIILRVNQTELKMFGYAEDEYVGYRVTAFMTPESQQTFRANFPACLEAGFIRNMELDFVCKDGTVRPCVVDANVVRGPSGEPLFTRSTLVDNTERRAQAQALERAMHAAEAATVAKSAFIANVSHELRTPMNAILGLSYLLDKSALPGEAHDLVRKMRAASATLMAMLNDVLDFSKIESGKMEVQSTPFRLGDILDNLAGIMATNARDKDLQLSIAPAPGGATHLVGDGLRLEQVLLNLTGNAIKFTHQGFVALRISTLQEDSDTITLRFCVSDSGIGIAPDKQKEIFAEFSQADGSTSRQYGGTGLGLTISRRLVEAMGGALEVSSKPGSGSEFSFALRFGRVAEGTQALPAAAPPPIATTARLAGLRMLVVDDSDINCEVAQRIFAGDGAQVAVANDGQQAIHWLQQHPNAIDIVLMDVQMPVLNGFEATQHIRRNPAFAALPIVAMTAGAFQGQQELASQSGMNGFISKPFDVDAAIALIVQLTRHAAPAEDLPGIALRKGLAAWRDAAVYKKFLGKFAAQYGDVVAQLGALDSPQAQALAHKLKGAAGSLALLDVAARAADLEATLRAEGNPQEASAQLQAAMAVALDSIRRYAPEAQAHI